MSDKPIKFDAEKISSKKTKKSELISENLLESKAKHLPAEVGLHVKPLLAKKGLSRLFFPMLSMLILSVVGFEAYQFVANLWSHNTLLGIAGTGLVSLTAISGGIIWFKGRINKKRFSQREIIQSQLLGYETSKSYGQVDTIFQQVTDDISANVDITALHGQYQLQKQANFNDKELIHIYSETVLTGVDKLALDIVSKHASECAVMVALSPLAAADMALVAWRTSKMLQELSRVYGCPQSTFGRLGLSKQVITNLMLTGASELVADAGVELLGKSISAVVSAKVAQGIGVGLLISRMGIQTMRLCRPVAFNQDNRPKLSSLRKAISAKVVAVIKSGRSNKETSVVSKQEGQDS